MHELHDFHNRMPVLQAQKRPKSIDVPSLNPLPTIPGDHRIRVVLSAV